MTILFIVSLGLEIFERLKCIPWAFITCLNFLIKDVQQLIMSYKKNDPVKEIF